MNPDQSSVALVQPFLAVTGERRRKAQGTSQEINGPD